MHSFWRLAGLLTWMTFAATAPLESAAADLNHEAEKTALAMDALSRMQGVDLDSNPKLKETVLRVLERTRGTPSFVKLVQQFKLAGQNPGLLEVAIAQPASEAGVEAARMILSSEDDAALGTTLRGTNVVAAVKLAEALGNSGDKRAVKILLPLTGDLNRDLGLRKQGVRSLAKTMEGATSLLQSAADNKLPEDLKFIAGTELNAVRWPEHKAAAAKLFPPIPGPDSRPLPPLAEMVKMPGHPGNGARIFTNAIPGCANCHVVNSHGIDLGPNLSEIGVKLGKDALLESILEPSSGISFGYEAYNFTLKNGDEVYGLLASETADEVAVKNIGGIITRLKKSEIESRQQSKLSIMPSGLHAAMSVQELVDLVEYLASLKKASPGGSNPDSPLTK